jgi:hypothetical protein
MWLTARKHEDAADPVRGEKVLIELLAQPPGAERG